MIVSIAIAATMLARPIQIAPEQVRQGADQPQIAFSKGGDICVTFGSGDTLYFTSSSDGGLTFGEAVEIGEATLLQLRDPLGDHAPQVTDPFFTGQALGLADDLVIDLLPFVIEGIREGRGGDELEEPAVLRRDLRDLRSHA